MSQQQNERYMSKTKFVALMKQFYDLGWMRGTGGAMGCVNGDQLFLSPSSLQKECIRESDIFVFDVATGGLVSRPDDKPRICETSCGCLFKAIIKATGAECVIHTHSRAANLLTQICTEDVFELSHQEYIKGIYDFTLKKNLSYGDTLRVPIVPNQPLEEQLLPSLLTVLEQYPHASALLVRNHGLFVWGPTWEKAKVMTECYDYLFDLCVEMKKLGLDFTK